MDIKDIKWNYDSLKYIKELKTNTEKEKAKMYLIKKYGFI